MGEFNHTQHESGHGECSNCFSHNWLKSDRPKVAVCPHREDYCNTCSKHKININAKQTTINHLKQASNSKPEELQKLEAELVDLKKEQEHHRRHKKLVNTMSRKQPLVHLGGSKLRSLKRRRHLVMTRRRHWLFSSTVLSADCQQCKLVPYWGMSDQPGSTYYLQKMNNDLFGVVNHGDSSNAVYFFDETVGPKNTDHNTLSFLTHNIHALSPWIKRDHLFLDNTSSTNKNFYSMAWAM